MCHGSPQEEWLTHSGRPHRRSNIWVGFEGWIVCQMEIGMGVGGFQRPREWYVKRHSPESTRISLTVKKKKKKKSAGTIGHDSMKAASRPVRERPVGNGVLRYWKRTGAKSRRVCILRTVFFTWKAVAHICILERFLGWPRRGENSWDLGRCWL